MKNRTDDLRPTDPLELLFQRALDVPAGHRVEWLKRECDGQPELYKTLLALLQADESNSDARIAPLPVRPPREEIPTAIGVYRVSKLIAEGSIGAVFEATHTGTGRRAAIKLIRAGFATTRQKLRFQLEAELLGKLNHPGIAHLYDAGLADVTYPDSPSTRRPFIAMEYVEGVPVSYYATSRALGVREKVVLIRDAAIAVAHAHTRGIIHRDLKPANLLVAAEGRLKVVDFGVAKLIESADSLTHEGIAVGTPDFMSPEQITGREEVDLSTDVYGLGATLYLLLTGKTPRGATGLLTPASAIKLMSVEIQNIRAVSSAVDPDLSAVVHHALEGKIEDRYPDAASFAADLDRWLEGVPTRARPLGVVGRTVKWVRRNRVRSAGIALVAAALVLAAVEFLHARAALTSQRIAVEEQAAALDYINDMLIRISPDAPNPLGPGRTLSDLIEQANLEIKSLNSRPRVQAQVRLTLAQVYFSLGNLNLCEENAMGAIAAYRNLGEESETMIAASEVLARSYKERSRLADAANLRWDVWKWRINHQGAEHQDTLWAEVESSLAEMEAGYPHLPVHLIRSEDLVRKIEHIRDMLGPAWTRKDQERLIRCREVVAYTYFELCDAPRYGERDLAVGLEESASLNGADHPQTLRLERIKAIGMYRRGDFTEALTALDSVARRMAARIGQNHPTVVRLDCLRADALLETGRAPEALALHEAAARQMQSALGPHHYQAVEAKQKIAMSLRVLGRLDEADALLQQCLKDYDQVEGPTGYIRQSCYRQLVLLRAAQGRLDEAVDLYLKWVGPVDGFKPDTIFGPEPAVWQMDLAGIHLRRGDKARAVACAELAARSMKYYLPEGCGYRVRAETLLARLKQQ